jgi:hypothetical protein
VAPGWVEAVRLDRGAHPSGPLAQGGKPAIDLDATVQANLGPIIVGLVVALLLVLLVALAQGRRITRVARRVEGLTAGEDGSSLEAVLGQHLERVRTVVRDIDRLEARTAIVERDLRSALGRVGLVRYNPFEDTGGAQSFALAILDGTGSGFVITSLHARTGTRIYAKSIAAGKAEAALSDEEADALKRALATPTGGGS